MWGTSEYWWRFESEKIWNCPQNSGLYTLLCPLDEIMLKILRRSILKWGNTCNYSSQTDLHSKNIDWNLHIAHQNKHDFVFGNKMVLNKWINENFEYYLHLMICTYIHYVENSRSTNCNYSTRSFETIIIIKQKWAYILALPTCSQITHLPSAKEPPLFSRTPLLLTTFFYSSHLKFVTRTLPPIFFFARAPFDFWHYLPQESEVPRCMEMGSLKQCRFCAKSKGFMQK